MKLGQLLVKKRIIDEDQLRAVLSRQRGEGSRLGEILVRLGLVSKRDVLSALATQPGFLLDSVALAQVEPAVARLVPRRVAEKLSCVAAEIEGDRLSVAMADPLDFEGVRQLEAITGSRIEPLLAGSSDIDLAIRLHYPTREGGALVVPEQERGGGEPERRPANHRDGHLLDGLVLASEVPTESHAAPDRATHDAGELPTSIHLQELILDQALQERASDVHIEPRRNHLCVRNRIDGRLVDGQVIPKWMHAGLISRFKVLAAMDIAERRLPQDGRCRLEIDGRQVDLRVSTLPTRHGEKMVLRILDRRAQLLELEELGLEGRDLECMLGFLEHPQGMLLLVGPTGSGKTTTLYSLLQRLDSRSQNIVTIEDPVEYEMPAVTHVQVRDKIGLEFSSILRSVLRQDPDVVLVGEIRDAETARIAVRAALTGHLLLSTLHTNSAVGTLVRLLDLGLAPFLLSSSLLGVASQRLIRRVCRRCAVPYQPDGDALRLLGLAERSGQTFVRGRGCTDCAGRGYRGRTAIFEILRVTDPLRRAIVRNASDQELRRLAVESGMRSLADAGAVKVKAGLVTPEDVAYAVRDVEWTGGCPGCDGLIEADFQICPRCGTDLRSSCPSCGRHTQPEWRLCPYCRGDLPQADEQSRRLLSGEGEKDDDDSRRELRALGPAPPN